MSKTRTSRSLSRVPALARPGNFDVELAGFRNSTSSVSKESTEYGQPLAGVSSCEQRATSKISQTKTHLVQQLRQKIRRVETTSRNDDGSIVSSGSAAIDQVLPAGGYHRGTIVEWISGGGSGAEFLSLTTARHAALDGGALVIVDFTGDFYPPAAAAIGINLGNLIVLRPMEQSAERDLLDVDEDDFLWAIDQSLRCPAVAAVWGQLPDFENSQSGQRWLRRFQLSAESSGCLGLFVRPMSTRGRPNWSEVQWLINPHSSPAESSYRRIQAQLIRCRGGMTGEKIRLQICTITGSVSLRNVECGTRNAEFFRGRKVVDEGVWRKSG